MFYILVDYAMQYHYVNVSVLILPKCAQSCPIHILDAAHTYLFPRVAHRLSQSTLSNCEHIHIYKLFDSGESWTFAATEHFQKAHISDPWEKWRVIKLEQVEKQERGCTASGYIWTELSRSCFCQNVPSFVAPVEQRLLQSAVRFGRGSLWWSRRSSPNLVASRQLSSRKRRFTNKASINSHWHTFQYYVPRN